MRMKRSIPVLLALLLCLAWTVPAALAVELTSITTYPLEKQGTTLRIWAPPVGKATAYASYNENPFHIAISEQVGIQIDWISTPAGADSSQTYNLMIASGDYPDIIFIYGMAGNASSYLEDGIIIPLNERLEQGAPDYWAFLQKNPGIEMAVKTDEGVLFGFPSLREDDWLKTYQGPAVRADWLEEQGLDIPVTLEDWTEMLLAFKEAYSAPYAARWMHGAYAMFGAYHISRDFFQQEGKVKYGPAEPAYKDYLTLMNGWYAQGLIDYDFATLDGDTLQTKVVNDKVGAILTTGNTLTTYMQALEQLGSGANWIPVPYPVLEEGGYSFIQTEDIIHGPIASISTACADVDAALAFLNYGWTQEGYLYWNFGVEGDTFTMAEGRPTFTDKILNAPEGIGQAIQTYTGTNGAGISLQAKDFYIQKSLPVTVRAIDVWTDVPDEAKAYFMPAVTPTYEETEETASAITAITTYMEEMYYKFIMGEESLDNFDAYVEKLNNMGLQRVLEVKNQQLERYNNR